MNTSATGGYLQPTPQFPVVSNTLSITQFLQTVFAGISGLAPDLVRPKWQINPPKQPDITTNWLALAIVNNEADANAYVGSVVDNSNIVNVTQRMEQLEIQCCFYGPQSQEYMSLTRDGFQIEPNRVALTAAKMGFVGTDKGHRMPDLVNERWCDRWEMSFFLNREILRAYPILTFVSASGTINAIVSENLKTVDWKSNL